MLDEPKADYIIMFCPNCGREQQAGERYCANCGTEYKTENSNEYKSPTKQHNKSISKYILWICVLGGAILLFYGIGNSTRNSSQQNATVKKVNYFDSTEVVECVEEGDYYDEDQAHEEDNQEEQLLELYHEFMEEKQKLAERYEYFVELANSGSAAAAFGLSDMKPHQIRMQSTLDKMKNISRSNVYVRECECEMEHANNVVEEVRIYLNR